MLYVLPPNVKLVPVGLRDLAKYIASSGVSASVFPIAILLAFAVAATAASTPLNSSS